MSWILRRSTAALGLIVGWYRSSVGLVSVTVFLGAAVVGIVTASATTAVIVAGLGFAGFVVPYKIERDRGFAAAQDKRIEKQLAAGAAKQRRSLAKIEGRMASQIARIDESLHQIAANDRQDFLIGEASGLLDDLVAIRAQLSALADASIDTDGIASDQVTTLGAARDGQAVVDAAAASTESRPTAIADLETDVGSWPEVASAADREPGGLESTIPLIFSINPGRSGSMYLERLLLSAVGAIGEHEQHPQMIGEYLRLIEEHSLAETIGDRYFKAHAIEAAIANADETDVRAYVDTSNMFVKTFADVVADYFDHRRIKVLHLRRDVVDAARSFRQLGFFTDTNRSAIDWTFDIRTPHSLAARYRRLEQHDPCSLIVGYIVETELRGIEFRATYPDIQVIDVRLEELQDLGVVQSLFAELGLVSDDQLTQTVARPVNQKAAVKRQRQVEVDDDFSARVLAELEHYLDAGAPIGALMSAPVVADIAGTRPDGGAKAVRPPATAVSGD